MCSNKYADFRKIVYYYWSDLTMNTNYNILYRYLVVNTIYLDDDLLQYRNNIINNFKKVLFLINELKYLPPSIIGRFSFQGGYLYHKSKKSFEKQSINY